MLSNEDSTAAAARNESEEEDEVECNIDDPSAEGRVPKAKRAPHEPTNEEIRLHEITHTPYRSWRPCCIAGRGKLILTLK